MHLLNYLKSVYDRSGIVFPFALIALLGYGYIADRIDAARYRCDSLQTANPPQPCPKTFWSNFS